MALYEVTRNDYDRLRMAINLAERKGEDKVVMKYMRIPEPVTMSIEKAKATAEFYTSVYELERHSDRPVRISIRPDGFPDTMQA